jgi:hypothetical protein
MAYALNEELLRQFGVIYDVLNRIVSLLTPVLTTPVKSGSDAQELESLRHSKIENITNECNSLVALLDNFVATLKEISNECEAKLSWFRALPKNVQENHRTKYGSKGIEFLLALAAKSATELIGIITTFSQNLVKTIAGLKQEDVSSLNELILDLQKNFMYTILVLTKRIAENFANAVELQNAIASEIKANPVKPSLFGRVLGFFGLGNKPNVSSDYWKGAEQQKSEEVDAVKRVTETQITPLLDYIKSNYGTDAEIKIADLGGADGILSKKILNELVNYQRIKVNIFDLNKKNFPKINEDKRIKYIVRDVARGISGKYDVILSRYVLHYNTLPQQEKIAEVIAKGITDAGFATIIEYVAVDEEQKEFMNSVYKKISEMKSRPVAYWLTDKELINAIEIGARKGGAHVNNIIEQDKQEFTIDFLKERNDLTEAETEELKRFMSNKTFYAKVLNIIIKKK